MSSGTTIPSVYTTDEGLNFPCRIQPETALLDFDLGNIGTDLNVPATATPDGGLPTIKLSTGRREYGVSPRKIIVQFGNTVGTDLPQGYEPSGRVPIVVFDRNKFDAVSRGQQIGYLGVTATVRRKLSEQIN